MDTFTSADDVDACYDTLRMEDSVIEMKDVNMDDIQELQHPISPKRIRNPNAILTSSSFGNMKWMERNRVTGNQVLSYLSCPAKLPNDGFLPWTSACTVNNNECVRSSAMDIFQVDKGDLIQDGPTLAELNATDDNLFDDLSFDDFLLLEETHNPEVTRSIDINSPVMKANVVSEEFVNSTNLSVDQSQPYSSNLNPLQISGKSSSAYCSSPLPSLRLLSPESVSLSPIGCPSPVETGLRYGSSEPKNNSTLHQLLINNSPSRLRNILSPKCESPAEKAPKSQQLPFDANVSDMRLCSSAPTHSFMETIWQHREPRTHLLSTGSLAEDRVPGDSTSSLSTDLLSPTSFDDDEYHSDGSDVHCDSSDFDSDDSDMKERSFVSTSLNKREKYFWQYNVQSKGPKGQRIVMSPALSDPHVLNAASDPVFNPTVTVKGIRHSGKARRGDGNDLTPNPRKLFGIGKELDKLFDVINDMTPVSELPFPDRGKTRKEKNKLASRACRLKKKAQHEANKIKVYGLEQEHRRLMEAISQVRSILIARVMGHDLSGEATQLIEKISKAALKPKIAGHAAEFVNRVIDRVKEGDHSGGLDELSGVKTNRLKK